MPPTTASAAGSALATRLAFLVSGFGLACWAPLVPLAKARLQLDDDLLGLLLLCLGLGSVLAMQGAGVLIGRYGVRPIIIVGGIGQAVILPSLAWAPTVPILGLALMAFGACLGLIDVAMNVHAVEVEKRAARPLMSGFHGLFSVGGFTGSLAVTAALSAGLDARAATAIAAGLMIVAIVAATPHLIGTPRAEQAPLFVVPRGIVTLLALLAAITFLTEGAILDWGALLLSGQDLLPEAQAGIGYSLFAAAMTLGRFAGDAVVARLGDRRTMLWGGMFAILGYVVLLTAPMAAVALGGFILIGLGASNTVPILFRIAGAQTAMPPELAVAAVTTVGYTGVLVGPAGVGFVAKAVGLPTAFWMLAVFLCLVPLSATAISRRLGNPVRAR